MKKTTCSKKQLVLVVSIIITTIVVTSHFFIKYNNSDNELNEVRVVSKIDNYSYYLDDNKSKIYIKYYNQLKKTLDKEIINEEEYATLISKLFIIDFYSLDNKLTNQDVGGLQFVYSDIVDNFKLKAKDTIYKYVENNIYSNRNQELPMVKDVEILEIKNINLEYLDKVYENSYEVTVNIIYEKDLGYSKSVILYLIHDDIKFSIVKVIEND